MGIFIKVYNRRLERDMIRIIVVTFLFLFSSLIFAEGKIAAKFDHEFHVTNVFAKNKVQCTLCHNFEKSGSGEYRPTEVLESKMFKLTNREMCHQCHQGTSYPTAPKTCFTCHNSNERLQSIKPINHQNANWRNGAHAGIARIDSASCLNCHSNSQCSTCHSERNTVMNQNHSKNYRYYHSIEARMNPSKCESCHTETYCIKCHLGGVK